MHFAVNIKIHVFVKFHENFSMFLNNARIATVEQDSKKLAFLTQRNASEGKAVHTLVERFYGFIPFMFNFANQTVSAVFDF